MKRVSFSVLSFVVLLITSCCNSTTNCKYEGSKSIHQLLQGKADKLILGNIITIDKKRPIAQAMTIKNGFIQYVGNEKVARRLCDGKTIVEDYGKNSVYPGFCESHAHGALAAPRLLLEADLNDQKGSMDIYPTLMKEYMKGHPGRELYRGSGWDMLDTLPDAHMLDAICPDVPMVLQSSDGHSMWLNTAALKKYGFTPEYAKEMGYDQVRVRKDGTPTGYISEVPVIKFMERLAPTKDEYKKGLLLWQEFAFKNGFTAASECFLNMGGDAPYQAYKELVKEGKWKLRSYAVYCIDENVKDVDSELQKLITMKGNNSEYFAVHGVKLFMDGVIEAHTGWLEEPYADDPTYYGLKRGEDVPRLGKIIRFANEHGMISHIHSIGDAATHAAMDAIIMAQEESGLMDNRNVISHLQLVHPEDIQRMGEYNVIAAIAPLWVPMIQPYYKQVEDYIGKERAWRTYPAKSFIDAGCRITFHTDYPISSQMSIPLSISCAVTRAAAEQGVPQPLNSQECITRYQSLEAMTSNVAYQWRQEDLLGSLTIGKVANYVVYNVDFLKDDLTQVANAELICTAVDGTIVYSNPAIKKNKILYSHDR